MSWTDEINGRFDVTLQESANSCLLWLSLLLGIHTLVPQQIVFLSLHFVVYYFTPDPVTFEPHNIIAMQGLFRE